jgi:DNA-directed RNA polymerase subunit F
MGNRTQLLRAEYVPAERDENGNLVRGTGRAKTKMIGSFPSYYESVDQVDNELLEKLSGEELEELESHLKEVQERMRAYDIETAPRAVLKELKTIAENYDPSTCTDDQIDQISDLLSKIKAERRAWKKRHGSK